MDRERWQGSIQAGSDVAAGRDIIIEENRERRVTEYTDVRHVRCVMRIQALQICLLVLIVIMLTINTVKQTTVDQDIKEIRSMLFYSASVGRRTE